MKTTEAITDRNGRRTTREGLDRDERALVARLRRRARTSPDWDAFDNYWTQAVPAFYAARGLGGKAVTRTAVWRIAQELSSRLASAAGVAREPVDYRDELETLILKDYPSRRAFCEATGLSQDMLSHVLAGRKDLSLPALEQALQRIGYRLRIQPAPEAKNTA